MGKIKKILENELVGGTQSTDVYPVTSIKAVYDENNERLDHILNRRGTVNISTNYNDDHAAEVLTLAQAIAKVPSSDRVLGFVGRFLSSEGWVTYSYNGENIANWADTTKWALVADSSNLSQEIGDREDLATSQRLLTNIADSYRVLLSLSPNMLYNKAYNETTGKLNTFKLLDCTRLIELPYSVSSISVNAPIYAIACFNYNNSYLGTTRNSSNLLSGTRFISISFLKEDGVNYSETTITIIPPYAAKEISRNAALHLGQGQISPLSAVSVKRLENDKVEITFNSSPNVFTNEGKRVKLNLQIPQSFTLGNYYSLVANAETGELEVGVMGTLQGDHQVVLAYNEGGYVVSGVLSSYCNKKVIETNFGYEQLNSGFVHTPQNIKIVSNGDKSIDVSISSSIWIFKNQGGYISIPSTAEPLHLGDQYSLFYDTSSKKYIVGSSQDKYPNSILLGFNDGGKLTNGLFANIYILNKINSVSQSINSVSQSINSVSQSISIPVGNLIMYGMAYGDKDGNLGHYGLLDCTPLISVPANASYVNVSQGPMYGMACFDKDLVHLGSVYTYNMIENTKYISISFRKTENIDYSKLAITFSSEYDYKICSNVGIRPGIMYKKAYHTTTGALNTFKTLDCTPMIRVPNSLSEATKIKLNKEFYEIACFGSNSSFLGAVHTPSTALKPGTKYFSISFLTTDNVDYNSLLISLVGDSTTVGGNNPVIPVSKSGKKYYLFGDSITYWDSRTSWYDKDVYMVAYPSYIRDVLGAEIVNKGVAGNTSNDITTRLLSTDLSDAYAITYMAGANDLHASVPIGEIGNLDRSTYIGNLSTAAEYVLTHHPNVKMYFLSPLWETNGGKGGYEAYAEAMDAVAKHYHIPILRWDLNSCIGELTADTFYVHEDTTRLHPNNDGHKRLADSLIPFLQSY